ncbi:AAA family ATPase [Candidatus Woesearchaeota archaeon]|nr:AAA family ATPase [Candidatus Woesearchaeota archaeon]
MGVFDGMLGANESLFRNAVALDFDFVPKLVPYREGEQFHIAGCIKPLFSQRSGRNLLIHGPPGVGKSVASRHVLRELQEKADDIFPLYVNCWQKNTSFKVALELCEQLGYRLTHNKNTDDLLAVVMEKLNKGGAVLVLDEVDKLQDQDFLYVLLERLYRKVIVLISNYQEWGASLDERLRSRLALDVLQFRPYSAEETRGILRQRAELAFQPDVFPREALERVVAETVQRGDLRVGLHLLKEAGAAAEEKAARSVSLEHVETALQRLAQFAPRKSAELDEDEQAVLELVKGAPGSKIGDLYKRYQESGGEMAYKSFQRKVKKLEDGGYIDVQRTQGGAEGNTSILTHRGVKTLDQF